MWIYLGILTGMAAIWYLQRTSHLVTSIPSAARRAFGISKDVYNLIRRNGFRACLVWAGQIITNQLGTHLIEMHHHYYIINYPYGVGWYKLIVPRRRGPCKIDTILDSDSNDVTKDVLVYMGPSHTFAIPVTPKMMGYESLTFTYLNGDTRTFSEDEYIKGSCLGS